MVLIRVVGDDDTEIDTDTNTLNTRTSYQLSCTNTTRAVDICHMIYKLCPYATSKDPKDCPFILSVRSKESPNDSIILLPDSLVYEFAVPEGLYQFCVMGCKQERLTRSKMHSEFEELSTQLVEISSKLASYRNYTSSNDRITDYSSKATLQIAPPNEYNYPLHEMISNHYDRFIVDVKRALMSLVDAGASDESLVDIANGYLSSGKVKELSDYLHDVVSHKPIQRVHVPERLYSPPARSINQTTTPAVEHGLVDSYKPIMATSHAISPNSKASNIPISPAFASIQQQSTPKLSHGTYKDNHLDDFDSDSTCPQEEINSFSRSSKRRSVDRSPEDNIAVNSQIDSQSRVTGIPNTDTESSDIELTQLTQSSTDLVLGQPEPEPAIIDIKPTKRKPSDASISDVPAPRITRNRPNGKVPVAEVTRGRSNSIEKSDEKVPLAEVARGHSNSIEKSDSKATVDTTDVERLDSQKIVPVLAEHDNSSTTMNHSSDDESEDSEDDNVNRGDVGVEKELSQAIDENDTVVESNRNAVTQALPESSDVKVSDTSDSESSAASNSSGSDESSSSETESESEVEQSKSVQQPEQRPSEIIVPKVDSESDSESDSSSSDSSSSDSSSSSRSGTSSTLPIQQTGGRSASTTPNQRKGPVPNALANLVIRPLVGKSPSSVLPGSNTDRVPVAATTKSIVRSDSSSSSESESDSDSESNSSSGSDSESSSSTISNSQELVRKGDAKKPTQNATSKRARPASGSESSSSDSDDASLPMISSISTPTVAEGRTSTRKRVRSVRLEDPKLDAPQHLTSALKKAKTVNGDSNIPPAKAAQAVPKKLDKFLVLAQAATAALAKTEESKSDTPAKKRKPSAATSEKKPQTQVEPSSPAAEKSKATPRPKSAAKGSTTTSSNTNGKLIDDKITVVPPIPKEIFESSQSSQSSDVKASVTSIVGGGNETPSTKTKKSKAGQPSTAKK